MTEDMSAEERARCIDLRNVPRAREQIAEAIHQAEAAAVAKEREACAKIAESQHLGGGYILSNYGKSIAVKIRARSEP